MQEQFEVFFRSFISAVQIASLYGCTHAKFSKFLDSAYANFMPLMQGRDEFVIGIVGEELAFEKEVLMELSKMLHPMVLFLKARGVERISFSRSATKEEFQKFAEFLTIPKNKIPVDPAQYLVSKGVHNISIGKVKTAEELSQQDFYKAQKALDHINLYNSSLHNFSGSIEKIMDAQEIDHVGLRFGIANLLDNINIRYQELLKLTSVKRYDNNTFVHMLNVAIVSMYVASRMGFSKEDILDIGIAGLFHDIGKLYISRSIIRKSGKLDDTEFARIRSHTVLGAQILLQYTEFLGPLAVLACFEHHLKYNVSGYPKVPGGYRPHQISLLISICDVYDALLQRRSYKNSYDPPFIYSLMMQEKGTGFDPDLLEMFFNIMGVWPVGAIVRLSDASIAVVREQSLKNRQLPKVEIISPADKKSMIDLSAAEALRIEKFLDPNQEGKEYIKLI